MFSATTTTMLWPLYKTTYISLDCQLRTGGLCWSSFSAYMPLLMATSSSWAEDAGVLLNGDTCSLSVPLSPSPLCLATADISNHNTYVDPAPDVALFSVDGLYFLTHAWLVRQQILHCSHPYVLLALSEQQCPQNNLHKQRNKKAHSTSSNLSGQKKFLHSKWINNSLCKSC